jgi:hypothetical protein
MTRAFPAAKLWASPITRRVPGGRLQAMTVPAWHVGRHRAGAAHPSRHAPLRGIRTHNSRLPRTRTTTAKHSNAPLAALLWALTNGRAVACGCPGWRKLSADATASRTETAVAMHTC